MISSFAFFLIEAKASFADRLPSLLIPVFALLCSRLHALLMQAAEKNYPQHPLVYRQLRRSFESIGLDFAL
jgi:hypothetical protein